jgi:hypothetical protein
MSESSDAPKKPLLSDGVYSKLKHTASIVLPAVAALYIALAQIWHFPNAEGVAGSIAAVNTFLGGLVALSSRSYNSQSSSKYAGEIRVTMENGKKVANLVVPGDPNDILKLDEALFKISDTGETPIIRS